VAGFNSGATWPTLRIGFGGVKHYGFGCRVGVGVGVGSALAVGCRVSVSGVVNIGVLTMYVILLYNGVTV
jgi:hypothetical protein